MAIRHVFLQTAMIRHIFVSEIIEPQLRPGAARAEPETGSHLLLGSQRLPRHRKSLSRLISMQGAKPQYTRQAGL